MRIERGSSFSAAYAELREMIVAGQLPAGGWLIEADLAQRLGISRTPLRAALLALQKEGYIKSSGSGAKSRLSVAPLTQADAQELYSIIGHLEGLAARLTALLPKPERAALLDNLTALNCGLLAQKNNKRPNPSGIFELDLSFHRTIVEAGAGPRLLELHRVVQPQAERYWRLYASAILDQLGRSVTEHAAVLKAIRAGDADGAEAGIQLNWGNGAKRLAKVIQTRGSW